MAGVDAFSCTLSSNRIITVAVHDWDLEKNGISNYNTIDGILFDSFSFSLLECFQSAMLLPSLSVKPAVWSAPHSRSKNMLWI